MKKVLGLIMSGIVVVTVIAQGQQIDEETLQKRVSEICKEYNIFLKLPEDARERTLEGGLSPEWVAETLENMVRKNLPILEQMRKDGTYWDGDTLSFGYQSVLDKATSPILVLGRVPGSDTLALLRECVSFEDYMVYRVAIDSYIAIAGGDSVPFLQEVLARRIVGNHWLAQHLGRVLRDLKKKGRDGDVEKLHIFLLEQLQEEQRWSGVHVIDMALCATLDGYAQSIQREQAVKRFTNLPEREDTPVAKESRREILAEIDKTPAGERTDLSKRFKLAEPKTDN